MLRSKPRANRACRQGRGTPAVLAGAQGTAQKLVTPWNEQPRSRASATQLAILVILAPAATNVTEASEVEAAETW